RRFAVPAPLAGTSNRKSALEPHASWCPLPSFVPGGVAMDHELRKRGTRRRTRTVRELARLGRRRGLRWLPDGAVGILLFVLSGGSAPAWEASDPTLYPGSLQAYP